MMVLIGFPQGIADQTGTRHRLPRPPPDGVSMRTGSAGARRQEIMKLVSLRLVADLSIEGGSIVGRLARRGDRDDHAADRFGKCPAGAGVATGTAGDRVDLRALGGGGGGKSPRPGEGRENLVTVRRDESVGSRIGERGRTSDRECHDVAAGDRSERAEVTGEAG